MKGRVFWFVLVGAMAVALVAGPELWAAPGQNPWRQTFPTRTPTSSPGGPPATQPPATATPTSGAPPPSATPTTGAPPATPTPTAAGATPSPTAEATVSLTPTATSEPGTTTPEPSLSATAIEAPPTDEPDAASPTPTMAPEETATPSAMPSPPDFPTEVTARAPESTTETPAGVGEARTPVSPSPGTGRQLVNVLRSLPVLLCAGMGLVLFGLLLLFLWRRSEE